MAKYRPKDVLYCSELLWRGRHVVLRARNVVWRDRNYPLDKSRDLASFIQNGCIATMHLQEGRMYDVSGACQLDCCSLPTQAGELDGNISPVASYTSTAKSNMWKHVA